MSLKLSTASGELKRQDAFLLNPHDIIVDIASNGRVDDHDEATVKELAESMHTRGQVQPVKIRKVAGDQPQLICGFRRRAAAIYIREHLDPKFLLAATVQNCNEEEAFILNIVENRQRRATTAIDDAHNARRLRERYGMDDAAIVAVLQCAPSWLATLSKLVMLPGDVQKKVADGLMSASFAAKMAGLDDNAVRSVVKAAEGDDGKVRTSRAADALRAVVEAAAVGGTGEGTGEGVTDLGGGVVSVQSGDMVVVGHSDTLNEIADSDPSLILGKPVVNAGKSTGKTGKQSKTGKSGKVGKPAKPPKVLVSRTLADLKRFLSIRVEAAGNYGCPVSTTLLAFIRGEIDEVDADQRLNDGRLGGK
jgi:ParB/RepB/Spo0J family partition protein